LVGFVISLPKFIISFFHWRSARSRISKPHIHVQQVSQRLHDHRPQQPSNLSNVVPLHRQE
jgi:hypothetical protein